MHDKNNVKRLWKSVTDNANCTDCTQCYNAQIKIHAENCFESVSECKAI